jgi:hypothetical protein
MPTYSVQLTEGSGTEFLWSDQAKSRDQAVALAREALERERGRSPQDALVSLEQKADLPDLEQKRLDASHDQAEAKRAYDAAMRDAERAGRDPSQDLVVQRTAENLETASAVWRKASKRHQDALDKHAGRS